MRLQTLTLVAIFLLFLFGCMQMDSFMTPSKQPIGEIHLSFEGDLFEKKDEKTAVQSFSVEKQILAKSPAEIVFLLDNSYSMSDDLLKLRTSLQSLLQDLTQSSVDYRIRFLSLSQAKPLSGQRFGVGGSLGTIFANVSLAGASPFPATVFDRASDASLVAKAADTASGIDSSLQYEMGIGAAAHFLNWNQSTATAAADKLRPGHIHFVTLSNEDNYNGFNNIRGANNALLPLYVHTRNIYRGTATKWGFCQAGAWAPKTTPSVPAQRLRSSRFYVQDAAVTEVGQGTAIANPTINTHLCRTNRYGNFWASADVGPSSYVCSAAKKVRCPSTVDGIQTWTSTTSPNNVACTPDSLDYAPRLLARAYSASAIVENNSCDTIVCSRVAKAPPETYTFTKDSFGAITKIDELVIPSGYQTVNVPAAIQNIKDVCPGELTATLPATLVPLAITSQNSVQAFDYAAAPGMTREEVRTHAASLRGVVPDGVAFSEEPAASNKAYSASASGFFDLVRDEHPALGRVLWHSIVGDGKPCGVVTLGGEVDDGAQYRSLSVLTGGINENICAPSFGPFLEKVAASVQYGPVLSYPLAAETTNRIRTVTNSTRKVELVADQDFNLNGTTIEFTPSAPIGPGDQIEVTYAVVE